MKKRYIFICALLVAFGALLFWLSGRSSNDAERAEIKIGYLNITASLPLFVAESEGYFLESNVSYKAIPMSTSNQLVDGLLTGALDIVVEASAVPFLASALRAPDRLKVFGASRISNEAPFDAMLVLRDSPIESLKALEGTSVGVFPGSTAAALLRKYLADQGVDTASITFVPIPPPGQLAALESGSISALHAYEPTIAIAEAGGKAKKLQSSVYAEMLSPNPQGIAILSARSLDEKSEEMADAIGVLERAMNFIEDEEGKSRDILAERMNLSPAVSQATVLLYMSPHDSLDANSLQSYADMLTSLGEIDGSVDVAALLYTRRTQLPSY